MKVFTSEDIMKIEATTQALIDMLNKDCNQGLEYLSLDSISTWEKDGKWEVSCMDLAFTEFSRNLVCEIYYRENKDSNLEPMGIYLHQKQVKRVYFKESDMPDVYIYSKVQRVEPITGEVINDKWVIR